MEPIRDEIVVRHAPHPGIAAVLSVLLPGLGQVPWDRTIAALYRNGYDHVVCVEHEDRGAGEDFGMRQHGSQLGCARFACL